MDILQKARAYDEALERAKKLKETCDNTTVVGWMEYIFPEPAEEDKTRKDLLNFLQSPFMKENIADWKVAPWIAWLEKQGSITKLDEEKENKLAKSVLISCAMSFINYLDAHKYDGKMCVSNGECEDIENSFLNAMWDRLHRYYCKYIEKQVEQKTIDIESMVKAYKQRIIKQDDMENNPLIDMCLASFKHGVENTLSELNGEQNLTNSAKTCKDKQELSDKIESKFHEGDFIVDTYCRGKIVALTNDAYLLDTGQGIPFSCEDNVHLWTIQDAKDGDVLEFDCGLGIFKRLSEDGYNAYCHCYLDRQGTFEIDNNLMYDIYQARPATKEQRAQLKKAMADAGYEWDSEKKELKKIEQKPTWSEEDEKILNNLIDYFKVDDALQYSEMQVVSWLKSLKDRLKGE